MKIQTERLFYADEAEFDDDYDGDDVNVIVPETDTELQLCFALLASQLGHDQRDMIPFAHDETGRWKPKYCKPPGSFKGSFIVASVPGRQDEPCHGVMVFYEDADGMVHTREVNLESKGLGVAQGEYFINHVSGGREFYEDVMGECFEEILRNESQDIEDS